MQLSRGWEKAVFGSAFYFGSWFRAPSVQVRRGSCLSHPDSVPSHENLDFLPGQGQHSSRLRHNSSCMGCRYHLYNLQLGYVLGEQLKLERPALLSHFKANSSVSTFGSQSPHCPSVYGKVSKSWMKPSACLRLGTWPWAWMLPAE